METKYLVSWVGVAVWMVRDGYDQVMSEMRSEQREESDMGQLDKMHPKRRVQLPERG